MKKYFISLMISFNLFGADCMTVYNQAIATKNTDPHKAIYEFSEAFKICPEPQKGNTLLQSAIIQYILLMEPHQALASFKRFLFEESRESHPNFAYAMEKYTNLKAIIDEIERIEKELQTKQDQFEDLFKIAQIYSNQLGAHNYATTYYRKAFQASRETSDVSYYMIGYSLAEQDLAGEAIVIFEDFLKRFPTSYLYYSSVDMIYRSKFLIVAAMPDGRAKKKEARIVIKEIDQALIKYKGMPEEIENHLKNYQKLLRSY